MASAAAAAGVEHRTRMAVEGVEAEDGDHREGEGEDDVQGCCDGDRQLRL